MMLSLRARLLLGLILLAAMGLVVSGAATHAALHSYLLDRVDEQLRDPGTRAQAVGLLNSQGAGVPWPAGRFGGPASGSEASQFPPGTYIALYSASSLPLLEGTVNYSGSASTAHPVLPQPLPKAGSEAPTLLSTAGTRGVSSYRVMVESLDQAAGDFLVVAIPLTDVTSTLNRLLVLEGAVGASVLLALTLLAWWIIRLSLRPLREIENTAEAIVGGAMGRRVEHVTPRTEVGRLGIAINAMLARIEDAFDKRSQSEQRLRRFVADASHELRTPLTSIRGYAEMLRRGAESSPDDAALARRRIEEESVRMTALVEDMLLLARLDQGRPLEMNPVSLDRLAADACADARAVAPRRAITLTCEEVTVTGDELRLRQVMGNLVRNAVVHTPPGSPLEVSLHPDGGNAVLEVIDHGSGLPLDQVARVFEPFHRVDSGRARDSGGSGLGLSIVAAVVEAHRGRVLVVATPGGGATFRVELPLT